MGHFDFLNFIFYKKKLMEIMIFLYFYYLGQTLYVSIFFIEIGALESTFLGGVQKLALGCTKVEGGL